MSSAAMSIGASAAAHAPFGRRVAALAIDAAILLLVLWAMASGAKALLGTGELWTMPWNEARLVAVERQVAQREDERMYDNSGQRTVDFVSETRRYADGTVLIYSVVEGVIRYDDGRVEPVRSDTLVGRNVRALLQLVAAQLVIVLLPFGYFAFYEAGPQQATPGKRVLGLQVVDLAGRRLSLARAIARQFLKLCDIASTGMGYLLAGLTGSGQALHDILAGTRVVSRETD
jgi:uncharacterized RDD family membrane protein YckC